MVNSSAVVSSAHVPKGGTPVGSAVTAGVPVTAKSSTLLDPPAVAGTKEVAEGGKMGGIWVMLS